MRVLTALGGFVRSTLEWLGFWTAVTVPLGYVYFFYNGLIATDPLRFVGLLGLHLVALIVGRGYKVRAAAERHMSTYRDGNEWAEERDKSPTTGDLERDELQSVTR